MVGLIEVPEELAVTSDSKLVDFTGIDVYPSRYKYVDGKVIIRSLMIENVQNQIASFDKLNTTLMIGDRIKIDIKFGHFTDGRWIDLYKKGVLRIKKILPRDASCEILMLVIDLGDNND